MRVFRDVAGPAAITLVLSLSGVTREGEALVVRGALAGAVTPAVERIVRAGAPVELRIDGELVHHGLARTLQASSVSVLRFDPLEPAFVVERGATAVRFRSLRAAVRAFSTWRLEFTGATRPGRLDLEVTAHLAYASKLAGPAAAAALWDDATPFLRVKDLQRLVREEP